MEEDEEDLYSEMQLEEGRRRSINSHNTLKVLNCTPSVCGGAQGKIYGGEYQGFREGGRDQPPAEILVLSHRLYNQAPCGFAWLSTRTLY